MVGFTLCCFRRRKVMASAGAQQEATIDRLGELRPEIESAITASLGQCLTSTDLDVGPCTVVSPGQTYASSNVLTKQSAEALMLVVLHLNRGK